MNKTELKVFLKGLANFYVVLMIIAFLPTPGKDCSPGRLVRCIAIYTIVSIVIFFGTESERVRINVPIRVRFPMQKRRKTTI